MAAAYADKDFWFLRIFLACTLKLQRTTFCFAGRAFIEEDKLNFCVLRVLPAGE